jgi:transketolase
MDRSSLINNSLNTIRFLSVDGVQTANSGHPGLPMGAAAIAYTIWMRHLRHDPTDPKWPNRDRFILSGGHGSMLIYTLLHLTGYDLPLEELKHFRQWGSKTPGHPEFGITPGIETTTGPLGQGFANGVGMAIAEAHLAAEFNEPEYELVDHITYAIITDGDLMEGITSEAASLAGHLNLSKLIYLYDDNRISIEGSTDLAFTEDRGKRFEAYGWHVQYVSDGNDVDQIDKAIIQAKADRRPSLILCRTTIGYGLPSVAGTGEAHGTPPGWEEINKAKRQVNWPVEPLFFIDQEVLDHFRTSVEKGQKAHSSWNELLQKYQSSFPNKAVEFKRRMAGELPEGWDKSLVEFPADEKGMATRVSSGKVINMLAGSLPELIGGSADLAPSTMTWINGSNAFDKQTPEGRNIHFGVREHGMAAITNGMAVHGGLIPFAATFLVFSDYCRGAIRLAAFSEMGSIWVFTHDSIGVGEDGPTHQPIEQLASLRLIPNLNVFRPADANEVLESWKYAITHRHRSNALILSRQNLPTFDRTRVNSVTGVKYGAYVLADLGERVPEIVLMASGSEVSLVYKAAVEITKGGFSVRVVSFPCWELFEQQDKSFQDKVLLPEVKCKIAVEAGVTTGWEKWVGCEGVIIGIDHFGASAPADKVMAEFGFSIENILSAAWKFLKKAD